MLNLSLSSLDVAADLGLGTETGMLLLYRMTTSFRGESVYPSNTTGRCTLWFNQDCWDVIDELKNKSEYRCCCEHTYVSGKRTHHNIYMLAVGITHEEVIVGDRVLSGIFLVVVFDGGLRCRQRWCTDFINSLSTNYQQLINNLSTKYQQLINNLSTN